MKTFTIPFRSASILCLKISLLAILVCPTSGAMGGQPENRLIEPGISLGKIHIGQTAEKVARLVGMNKYLESGQVVVRYGETGGVIEIMTTSGDFETKDGFGTQSSQETFRRLFPAAQITCTVSRGGSGMSTERIFDDVKAGIAFSIDTLYSRQTESVKTITVHRKGVPVSIFGEIVDCSQSIRP